MDLGHVYTPRLEGAIRKSVLLHRDQVRRTPDRLPYISHLFSILVLLLKYTCDEDTLIAGLLHDAVEDTDYTFEELERDFGKKVSQIVAGVTEEKDYGGVELPWKIRKQSNLDNFKSCSQESLLICAVDKIYNLNALVDDATEYGANIWEFLSPGAEEKLWYHRETIDILEKRITNRDALQDVKEAYQRAHEFFLETPCPDEYSASNKSTETEAVRSRINLWTLRSPLLSARIFGYGKRNTN